MAQLAVHRPLDERHLHDDLRPHPVSSNARKARSLGEGRCCNLDCVETPPQLEQELGVESGPDLAGEDEVLILEIADEQRAEADTRTLRIGVTTDDQFLRRLALHLQPVLGAAVLVWRSTPLGDHTLPSVAAGLLPRLVAVEEHDALERPLQRQPLQQGVPLLERQRRGIAPIQPEDVEDVVAAAVPCHFAVENHLVYRKTRNRGRQVRQVLGQTVA
jgi:hypothetical protein